MNVGILVTSGNESPSEARLKLVYNIIFSFSMLLILEKSKLLLTHWAELPSNKKILLQYYCRKTIRSS